MTQADQVPTRNGPDTWVRLLRERAQHRPELVVCTFLTDGDAQDCSFTYGELDARARTIGAALQAGQAGGGRALLLYPPGLEYIAAFLGCLYAGVSVVPVYPPHPARLDPTVPKLRAIAADVQPDVVLTTAAGSGLAAALASRIPELRAPTWVSTDDLSVELAERWRDPGVSGESVAFIQYTSGSTAAPKGVVLTHKNTLHNSAVVQEALGHTVSSVGVMWLPPYHDMGLMGGLLQPLYVGFPVVVMSPLHFLQRPLRWLTAITRYRATTIAGPNFAYDLCVRRTTPEQRMSLDLGSVESAVVGAEPVNPATVARFAEAFAPCGFRREVLRPSYGLAESTLMVTASSRPSVTAMEALPGRTGFAGADGIDGSRDLTSRTVVSCGRPRLGQAVVVVDPATGIPCPPDTIGEVWVSGPSVAAGYWNRPEETAATFGARLAAAQGDRFLRTGDLGFMREGDLYITGRLKDLIIIRGRNIHPTDIEWTVERCHPGLRPGGGAAFSIPVDGEEKLVVVHELERHQRDPDHDGMTDAIRRAIIDEHDLLVFSVRLVGPGSIPRTSSGKTQRAACRELYLAGAFDGSRDSRMTPVRDPA